MLFNIKSSPCIFDFQQFLHFNRCFFFFVCAAKNLKQTVYHRIKNNDGTLDALKHFMDAAEIKDHTGLEVDVQRGKADQRYYKMMINAPKNGYIRGECRFHVIENSAEELMFITFLPVEGLAICTFPEKHFCKKSSYPKKISC